MQEIEKDAWVRSLAKIDVTKMAVRNEQFRVAQFLAQNKCISKLLGTFVIFSYTYIYLHFTFAVKMVEERLKRHLPNIRRRPLVLFENCKSCGS